jgi:hypothetical protein
VGRISSTSEYLSIPFIVRVLLREVLRKIQSRQQRAREDCAAHELGARWPATGERQFRRGQEPPGDARRSRGRVGAGLSPRPRPHPYKARNPRVRGGRPVPLTRSGRSSGGVGSPGAHMHELRGSRFGAGALLPSVWRSTAGARAASVAKDRDRRLL